MKNFLLLSGLVFLLGGPGACGGEQDDPANGSASGADGGQGATCSDDESCGLGEVCERGRCVPACIMTEDCVQRLGEGWICRSKRCVSGDEADAGTSGPKDGGAPPDTGPPPIRCDPPCPESKVCHHGLCVERCQAPLPCPGDVHIDLGSFGIDAYEASRPDSSAEDPGCNDARACSAPGHQPWTNVSWPRAKQACEDAGKRLCTDAEWRSACASLQNLRYPHGDAPDAAACNGAGSGFGDIWPGGSSERCVTTQGVYDLSGNVQEWLGDDVGPSQRATLGGSYMSNLSQIACDYAISLEAEQSRFRVLGFRCCSD